MDEIEIYKKLMSIGTSDEMRDLLNQIEQEYGEHLKWVPVGGRGMENNRGVIEMSLDPGRALIERITNGIDAMLEQEYKNRHPNGESCECSTPREAAYTWLGIPLKEGVGGLTTVERQAIAKHLTVTVESGNGEALRTIIIRDYGIGISPERFASTILSLNFTNKWDARYLIGSYGQGGSATFATAISKYTFIASRAQKSEKIGYTIVRHQAASVHKTGNYIYLTIDGKIPEVSSQSVDEFAYGTRVTHFGYNLSKYVGYQGSRSVYGLLNRSLFDPIIPIYLYDKISPYNRTIAGTKALLNGNLPETETGRGQLEGGILHHGQQINSSIGDYGGIRIEYWVLPANPKNKRPIDGYVEVTKPIILTENGQNRGEMSQTVISKGTRGNTEGALLPFLDTQIIVHIDCDSLTAAAKEELFVSTREGIRHGPIYDLIRSTLVQALKSDEELARLNREARESTMQCTDEEIDKKMRKEIMHLLNVNLTSSEKTKTAGADPDNTRKSTDPRVVRPPKPHTPLPPIELHEPPTYIKIIYGDETDAIPFYAGEQRYIRVETDANSTYYDPAAKNQPFLNVIATDGTSVEHVGYTALSGGRLKIILRARPNAGVGDTGTIRIELTRRGLTTLYSQKHYTIIETPPTKNSKHSVNLPDYHLRDVNGPDDPNWAKLDWPSDVNLVASENLEDSEGLNIYYSTAYPPYLKTLSVIEQKNASSVQSYKQQYRFWTGVYSLLIYLDQKNRSNGNGISPSEPRDNDDDPDVAERNERCRQAQMAAIYASRAVQGNLPSFDEEP